MYAKDTNASVFKAYDRFENFKRPDDLNLIYYINELERLNNQLKNFEMELPADILAYKVLENGNISNEKEQLIRAVVVSLVNVMKFVSALV